MGWGYSGSQSEPLAITFGTTLTNTGPNQFRVCGYNRNGGWMQAYEVAAAACPATAGRCGDPGRLVPLRHRQPQQSHRDAAGARVQPLASHGPPALRARPAADVARRTRPAPTPHGTRPGARASATADPSMDCDARRRLRPRSRPASRPAPAKTTQEQNPAPDAERIAIPDGCDGGVPRRRVPDRRDLQPLRPVRRRGRASPARPSRSQGCDGSYAPGGDRGRRPADRRATSRRRCSRV